MNEHDRINVQMAQLQSSLGGQLSGLLGGIGSLGGQAYGLANAQAQYFPPSSPEEIAKEDARKQCALAMKYDRQTRRFMEKALPLDWCHSLYPEAYER